MSTPVPPFQPGEEAAFDLPEEAARLLRRATVAGDVFGSTPCVWFDAPSRRCRFYEVRPEACRRFDINSDLCRLSRWEHGIDV